MKTPFLSRHKLAGGGVLLAFALGLAAVVAPAPGYSGSALAEEKPAPKDAAAQPPLGKGDNLVLDERCYWRHYIRYGFDRISSAALEAEGEKILGAALLDRKRKEAESWMKSQKIDTEKNKWTASAYYRYNRNLGNAGSGDINQMPPPPENWSAPDFDDYNWLLLRKPVRIGLPGVPAYWGCNGESLGAQAAYYRTRFEVPDPAKCGELSLGLVFHGGVRVFVNGQEIARGGLPEGTLAPDVPGNDYPAEAYQIRDDEWPANFTSPFKKPYCPELYGAFENASCSGGDPKFVRNGFQYRNLIPRPAWERIQKIRDRVLGPLTIPPNLLKKGVNVLAVELRASALHPIVLNAGNFGWDHVYVGGMWCLGQVLRLELRSQNPLPPANTRPAGVQVWAENIHRRIFAADFNPPGEKSGTLRIAGLPNGAHSAQLVVGTSSALSGLKVSAGDLQAAEGGETIPGSAFQALFGAPLPITRFGDMGWSRSARDSDPGGVVERAVQRYAASYVPNGPWAKDAATLAFFDQLASTPPPTLPADSSQTVWLSWKIPANTRPGLYRGSVRVEAQGLEPVSVPVEAEVIGWRLPDVRNFQTVVAFEHSPYGVAKQYKVPLWSDEHFRLLEASLRHLGRAGNDWLNVPIIRNSEFGNLGDSMVKWIRKKDGKVAFDLAILDRYLTLVCKHWGPPRIVNFVVMVGYSNVKAMPPTVDLLDEATGKTELLHLGGEQAKPEEIRKNWRALALALHEFMQKKGLANSMHWGYMEDSEGNPDLKALLAEFLPGVYWTSGKHCDHPDPKYYKAFATIYDAATLADKNTRAWNKPRIHLMNPRWGGGVHTLEVSSSPFLYRQAAERALAYGRMGVGRVGADYWEGVYLNCPPPQIVAGLSVLGVLWPGKDGSDTSVRYEAFLEGLQEAEARIFLEQAGDRGLLNEEQLKRATGLLSERIANPREEVWQESSRKLYQMAAETAAVVGLDVDKTEISAEVAAKSAAEVQLRLRNWTFKPRAWKAASSEKWIVPAKSEGVAEGVQALAIRLDASALESEKSASGTLTVTDTESGRNYAVKITASVGKTFNLQPKQVFNPGVGQEVSRDVILANLSGAEIPWKLESSVPWIKSEPAAGTLALGGNAVLKLTVRPPDAQAATSQAVLTVSETNGTGRSQVQVITHVIPVYQPPAAPPAGEAVFLDEVSAKMLKTHVSQGTNKGHWWTIKSPVFQTNCIEALCGVYGGCVELPPETPLRPLVIGKKTFARGLWTFPQHATTYKLDGSWTAFSSEVGLAESYLKAPALDAKDTVLCFEIYVDGQLRTQSGLMRAADEPRLLVVDGLAGAKEISLVTRLEMDGNDGVGTWGDPKFYKGK